MYLLYYIVYSRGMLGGGGGSVISGYLSNLEVLMLGHALLLLLLLTLTGTPGMTYGGLYCLKIAMNYFKFLLDNKHVLKT